jgi:hypothetical protein
MTQPYDPVTPAPAAGWYPQGGTERWWDGVQWTDHVRPRPTEILPEWGTPQGYAVGPAYGQPLVPQPQQFLAPGLPATDQSTNGAEVAIAWIATLLSLGYLLPWAIAATRGKSNSSAIGLLNFFLGWTFVGWVVALVMACGAHQQRANINMVQMVNVPQFPYPPQGPGPR